MGLDFPTSYPEKIFEIIGYEGKKPKYALLGDKAKLQPEVNVGKKETADRLPEEKITGAWGKHIAALKADIVEQILRNTPTFFERLVVDLLLKMGYGYDNDSGFVTGQSHDGGIDGIKYRICRRPSTLKKLSRSGQYKARKAEYRKSSVRCKIEHVFGVVKNLFRCRKTRYRGKEKVDSQLKMVFALANLFLADTRYGLLA